MIEGVQQGAKGAAQAMETGQDKAQQTLELVQRVDQALGEIKVAPRGKKRRIFHVAVRQWPGV